VFNNAFDHPFDRTQDRPPYPPPMGTGRIIAQQVKADLLLKAKVECVRIGDA